MRHVIVIDDTGSPGNFNQSRFLKEDRKTLVGVFIHSDYRESLENIITGILTILKNDFPGIKGLHFKDLINKNKEFSDFDNEDVVEIVDNIAEIFSNMDLPYFVQTIHKNTLKENNILISEKKIDNFDLEKSADKALLFLLGRISEFIKNEFPDDEVEIIMDEGDDRKKNVTEIFEFLKGISVGNAITYKSSEEYLLLQVADFFAYGFNRIQTTSIKKNRTDLDKALLRSFTKALENQFSSGTTTFEADINHYGHDDYDYEIRKKWEEDGNLEKWQNAQKE